MLLLVVRVRGLVAVVACLRAFEQARLTLAVAAAAVAAVAAINVPSVTLMNAAQPGVEMPVIGLGVGAYGTINGTDGEWWDDATCSISVQQWLAAGGRRLDTSLKVRRRRHCRTLACRWGLEWHERSRRVRSCRWRAL